MIVPKPSPGSPIVGSPPQPAAKTATIAIPLTHCPASVHGIRIKDMRNPPGHLTRRGHCIAARGGAQDRKRPGTKDFGVCLKRRFFDECERVQVRKELLEETRFIAARDSETTSPAP